MDFGYSAGAQAPALKILNAAPASAGSEFEVARSEHLPIYKASYDLCLYFEDVVRGFSRYHKYGLGSDLRDGARRLLKLVVRANARADKVPVLLDLREELEELKVVARLCHDARALPNMNSFERAAVLLVDIAKQNEVWIKSQRLPGRGQNRSAIPARPAQKVIPKTSGVLRLCPSLREKHDRTRRILGGARLNSLSSPAA